MIDHLIFVHLLKLLLGHSDIVTLKNLIRRFACVLKLEDFVLQKAIFFLQTFVFISGLVKDLLLLVLHLLELFYPVLVFRMLQLTLVLQLGNDLFLFFDNALQRSDLVN